MQLSQYGRTMPALGELAAQLEHRRVGRQHVERPARRTAASAVDRGATSARPRCGCGRRPRTPGACAISAPRVPVTTACSTRALERLEVDVPDPRHVAAVGDPVVEGDQQRHRRRVGAQRSEHLVGAGRVLDQQQDRLAACRSRPARTARTPPRTTPARGRTRSSVHRGQAAGERRRGERVVDVVDAGEREPDAATSRRPCTSRNSTASSPWRTIRRAAMSSGARETSQVGQCQSPRWPR